MIASPLMESSKRRRVNNSNHDAQWQAIFPPEIFCEILARLPMASLVRCRSVCKSWYRMTRNSYFVNLQLNIARSRPSLLMIQPYKVGNRLHLLDIKECKVREIRLEKIQCRTRFKLQLPVLGVRCSCDGLLCFALDYRLDPVFVCNPITRECVILPFSSPKAFVRGHQLGFGFDKSSGKYKVVREYWMYGNSNLSQFQIITLGESSWRQLNPPENVSVSHSDAAVFWNGSLHWIINNKDTDEPILAFNLSDEKFYTIPFPRLRWSVECYELLVLDGRLTVVEHDSHIMKIWEVSGNQNEGFSVHCREEHDTYVCWNKYHYYTTISQPTCNSFFIRVSVTDSNYVKRDWFKNFVPKMAQYFNPDIQGGLPDHFTSVHFQPSFVSPVEATPGSKSASIIKEQLDMVLSEWQSFFGPHCPKPSKGTLTRLFFSKWRWA